MALTAPAWLREDDDGDVVEEETVFVDLDVDWEDEDMEEDEEVRHSILSIVYGFRL